MLIGFESEDDWFDYRLKHRSAFRPAHHRSAAKPMGRARCETRGHWVRSWLLLTGICVPFQQAETRPAEAVTALSHKRESVDFVLEDRVGAEKRQIDSVGRAVRLVPWMQANAALANCLSIGYSLG